MQTRTAILFALLAAPASFGLVALGYYAGQEGQSLAPAESCPPAAPCPPCAAASSPPGDPAPVLANDAPGWKAATVSELWRVYDANEARGDQRFKGQRIRIFATVLDISRSAFDQTYNVTMGSGEEFLLCKDFDPDQVAYLDPGDEITVEGVGDGFILAPILDKCFAVVPR